MTDWIDNIPAIERIDASSGTTVAITYANADEELIVVNFEGENHVIERGLLRKLYELGYIASRAKAEV